MQIAHEDTCGGVLSSTTATAHTLLIDFNARCNSYLFSYTRCSNRNNSNAALLLVSFLFKVFSKLLFIVEYLVQVGICVPILLFEVQSSLLEPVNLAFDDLSLLVLSAR